MKHLNERELSAMADAALEGEALWRAQQHLEACEDCRDALAEISARDAALDAALRHDPGERYFAAFADRVVGRIAEAERAGEADTPVRGAAAERGDMLRAPIRLSWWQSPRALAMVGTAAVVVAGAGIVLMTARQAELPLARRADSPAARATQPATEAAPLQPPSEETAANLEPAPDAATFRDEAQSAAPLPTPPPSRSNAMSSPGPAPVVPAPGAFAPAPTAGESRPAAGTRMQEVPRTRTGDQRVAKSPTSGFAAPPPIPAAGATTAEKLRELKRAAISPSGQKLEQEKSLAKEADDAAAGAAAPAVALDLAQKADEPRTVCGAARDDTGRPLAGVTVSATGLAISATTGADGRFCLSLPPGSHELQLLAVGFRPARLVVTSESSESERTATLHPVAVLGSGGLARGGEGTPALDRTRQTTSPLALGPNAAGNALRADAAAGPTGLSLGDAPFRAIADPLRSQINGAARLQTRAVTSSGPSGYESAAVAWERLLPAAPGGAAEVEVHARVAECRFAAWRRSPDARRSSRAVEALTRYVARAPAGDRRDLAARWLDQIRSR